MRAVEAAPNQSSLYRQQSVTLLAKIASLILFPTVGGEFRLDSLTAGAGGGQVVALGNRFGGICQINTLAVGLLDDGVAPVTGGFACVCQFSSTVLARGHGKSPVMGSIVR